MQRSIKKLRPKANKLKSFSANWKRGDKALNIELGEQIALLMEKETFPDAIAMFFEIPAFKRVLKNLKSGSLWKDVYVFTEEDVHPPEEILKVQNIANAFQRLCTIAHYPNFPKDPLAKAKLLTENIHDYLFTITILKSFKGKASAGIQKQLFYKQRGFVRELSKIIQTDKELFLPLKGLNNLKELKNLNLENLTREDTKITYELLSRLYICRDPAEGDVFLCHKILNRMQKEIENIFDSIEKNAPFYLPYFLKKQIGEKTKGCTDSKALYSTLLSSFDSPKLQIIETKQESHRKNVEEACINLHILERSLDLIWVEKDLPESFKIYYKGAYSPIKHLLSNIHLQNSQIGYFLSGFFQTQISYLLEQLNDPPEKDRWLDFGNLGDDITSFLERYAKIKPELYQEDIKNTLCFEHIQTLAFSFAKSFVDDTFSLLIPTRDENIFLTLEKDSRKILLQLLNIYNEMDPTCYMTFLLKEKIKNLYLIDIPSFSLGWYIFGEISSCLYILHKKQNKNSEESLTALTEKLYQYPIFSILLK